MASRAVCFGLALITLAGCGESAAISKSAYESALQVTSADDGKEIQLTFDVDGIDLQGMVEEHETILVTASGEYELGTAEKTEQTGRVTAVIPRDLVGIPSGEKIQTIRVKYRVYKETEEERELLFEGEKEFPGS